ncbi:polysaccharide biosynthesis tyrosine autokinase [Clostridium isatidis]|uniref:polysaccharide biosynthesis tyrosine autokinase n=1 Tax=Clostridium isatidis TaxID=182773 RepID=UPI003AB0BF2E
MEPEVIRFEDVIRGCIKKWKEILIFGILTAILAGVVLSIFQDDVNYQGNFKVLVKYNSELDENGNVIRKNDKVVQNYIELMKTRDFVGNALKRTDLNFKPEQILGFFNFTNIENSDFIQIKYTSADNQQTEKVLKAMKEELITVAKDYNKDAEVSIEEDIVVFEKTDMKNSKMLIILGFVGGVAIASGATFIFECINKTFRTKGELEREIKFSVIGNIPKAEKNKSSIIKNGDDTLLREAYNSLAANIKFGKEKMKVITVTSSTKNEGATTTAINLALSLKSSNKILLIDGNLKKPSIGEKLGLNEGKGLKEVILGKSNLKDAIVKFDSNLDILLSGEKVDDSISILDSNDFNELLNSLKEEYDFIIIDTPPLQIAADVKFIANRADGLILVVRAEFVRKDIVKSSIDNLKNSGVELIEVVFNSGDRFRNTYHNY